MFNRNSIGIEKDEKNLPIIKKRMTPKQKIIGEEAEIEYIITEGDIEKSKELILV